MAILRRESDLCVLRIRLDRRGLTLSNGRRASAVVFELAVGEQDAVELTRLSPAELGIVDDPVSAYGDQHVSLPGELLVDPQLTAALAERSALWLELPAPSGPLRTLPWEMALRVIDVPVLRLPYFALRPRETDGPLTLVLCVSTPLAKNGFDVPGHVSRFVDAALAVSGVGTVHVFADGDAFDDVRHIAFPSGLRVEVHDPAAAAKYRLPPRSTDIDVTGTVANPWLLWIRERLTGAAVDHLHFLCHGYLASGGGALALAASPLVNEDRRFSRFVGAPELLDLMSATGAWSAGFTGPEGNYSPLGLRALADAVAEGRPGPVLAHAVAGDPDLDQLQAALVVTIGTYPTPPPVLDRTAVWVHPQRVDQARYPESGATSSGDGTLDELSHSMLFGTFTEQALAAPTTPTWVATSARVLEQAQARWLSSTQTGFGDVSSGGSWSTDAEEALRFVSGILETHVQQDGGLR